MRITVFGKGHVGGGLADLWERAGHQVTRFGRDGGDVSDAEVVLIAIPGGEVAAGLGRLTGLEGKTVIDATNRYGVDPRRDSAAQRRVHKVRDGRTDRQVVQRQLRVALATSERGPRQAEQPLVRRRGGARGRGAAQP